MVEGRDDMTGGKSKAWLCCAWTALCLLTISGCGGASLKKLTGEQQPASEYYIDARSGFAIEHPQSWPAPVRRQNPARVVWNVPADDGGEPVILVTVTVLRPEQAVGGYDSLLEAFRREHPNFRITSRDDIDTEAAAAQRLTGHTPDRTYLLALLTSDRGAFILSFSTPPEDFQGNQAIFEDMIASFRIVD
jgi:hypothetical protein